MPEIAYRLGSLFSRSMFWALSDVCVTGAEHMPDDGPVLLMGNHVSHFDPPVFGMMFDRQVFYMADLPLLQIPVVGKILHAWDAFPVDRTKPDRAAVKTALNHLKQGRCVGIFPEGGLRYHDKSVLHGGRMNAGSIALWQMAKVPVLPGVIIGTDQLYQWRALFRRPRVFVKYGPPLAPPAQGESREALHDRLGEAIRRLHAALDEEVAIAARETPRSPQDRWAERWGETR